ncbi:hypothetical protein B1813_07015 [Saccharomonospora piscinae]|uniref:Uncharacterized protein n=1 Tax=Saccharomonospora piscinae TaxID=687388 RepID=A0A1V9A7G3_SACPI|nr:hypothetical protein [Saccharomonospora piscinae]OQO93077.1 hypothetical protein B1813_07015 [Saccharomonospora piscinae]
MAELRDVNQGAGATVGGAMFGSGGSMSAGAMAKMTNSADALVTSAKAGGFKVTKEAADPIIKTLEEFITQVDELRGELDVFDQAPELGKHYYGELVARRMWEAANDDRSARAALNSLKIVLEQSREALLRASSQYQEQEESAQDSFRGMGE